MKPTLLTRRRMIVGLLALAGLVAVAVVFLGGDDGSGAGRAIDGAPPIVDAGRPHPGGDSAAGLVLPPDDQIFGFSSSAVAPPGVLSEEFDVGATPERAAEDVVSGGGNAFRVLVGWVNAEPRPGSVDAAYLAYTDRIVKALARVGARPLFVLDSIPPWAQAKPGDPRSGIRPGPDMDAAFARFAASVAKRWPKAAGIEILNEPNVGVDGMPGRSPERYASLLRAASAAIRDATPDLSIVVGGLAGTDGSEEDIMSAQEFLKRAFGAGLRPSDYDAVAIHPYPGQRDGRMDDLGAGSTFAAILADFRAGFRWIDPDARIWVTEVGLSTSGEAPVSRSRQASGIVALVRQLSSMIDIDAIFVHTLYDIPAKAQSDGERGFGVLVPHRTGPNEPKAAFCALHELALGSVSRAGC